VKTRVHLPALLIWIAYFTVPNEAGGLAHGIPLGPISAAAVLVIGWLALAGTRLPGAGVVAALLIITFGAGQAIPGEGGFRARYFASASASGAHERSIEYPDAAFTRVDATLAFDQNATQFPLPFINDNSRFNFYKVGEPNRRLMDFAVRWSGLWWVEGGQPAIYVHAPDATAQLSIDGELKIEMTPEAGSPVVIDVPLTAGWHRLDIMYSSPYGGPRTFSAGVVEDGTLVPFDAAAVVTQQIRDWQMTAAHWLRRIKTAADAALLLILTWLVIVTIARVVRDAWTGMDGVQLRHVVTIFAAIAAVDAWLLAWPWWHQNMVLIGGDDTMTYEGYARDIVLNGILMNGGRPPGEGEPFYYQAFYPYFLAGTHLLFGESMFGPVLVQRLLAAVAVWKLVQIAIDFSVERIWIVALPIAGAFLWWKFRHIAAQPLNESLYVPLLVVTTASLIRLCRSPSHRAGLVSGGLSGLTTITRSTVLLSWAIVWPVCWLAMKGRPHRHSVLAVVIASTLAVFSLIAIRNWIVADVFAPTSTELGITLLGGNEVPAGVQIDLNRRATVYQRFGIGELTATVIEYAITAPGLFAQNMARKAVFALGFYEPYAPGWGYSPVYIAVWTSAVAGLVLAWRSQRSIVVLLPALIAVTQYIAVVIVYPKGERLIVPIHTLLVPYSAITAWFVLQTIGVARRPRSGEPPA
jgi:hypothetical protein